MNTFANSTKDLADGVRHMVDEADQFLKVAALDELESQTAHQARRAARRADHVIHAHPYQAIGRLRPSASATR
jgi:ElaB/YqjD/DUF883 family membrane-anchored ribosome-binding protein